MTNWLVGKRTNGNDPLVNEKLAESQVLHLLNSTRDFFFFEVIKMIVQGEKYLPLQDLV